MKHGLKITKKFIYISALVFVVLFSVGYSALFQTLNIGGSTRYNKKYPIRVTDITLQGTSNNGLEQFNPNYTYNTTTIGVNLPNINSTVTYTVTVKNYGNEDKGIILDITSNSNTNMTYELSNMPTGNIVPANSSVSFNLTIKYNTSTLPNDVADTMTITYIFGKTGAMFDTGQNVNTKMKKFVNSSATYSTQNTTITNIARYTDIPDSTYLTDTYKVSVDEYVSPIYMWYDSTNTTIYWYSEANNVYYNPDSSYFYSNLRKINSISCINDISSEYVTNMSYMFYLTGFDGSLALDLGPKFDTSNVTNMSYMFYQTGEQSTVFTLDLGNNFDTSDVTNMQSMFWYTGYSSTVFTLDLGDKFDTSNVTDMSQMFNRTGYSNPTFTLDLGDKFDTSNVTNMSYMFHQTGDHSTVFTLDLGNNFDTSNVTNMSSMFYMTGFSSTSFTLDLGDKFDTSNVTDMSQMFNRTGYSSTVFTLDLGSNFDTSKVTDMSNMFNFAAKSSTVFTLNLGDKFDTTNVTNMSYMFSSTGYSSTAFTLDLGENFNTSNVTNMSNMFYFTGYSNPTFTLDLGENFDTSNVTNMYWMFDYTGYSSTVFTLDLENLFDTSKVTNMQAMFNRAGFNSTTFTLDLGNNFDTSNVTDMSSMFNSTGYSNTDFILNLGNKFDTSKVTNMDRMFYSFVGTTIYAPSTFVTASVTSSIKMFDGCTNLVGGLGTAYNSSKVTATYAHIDGGPSNPGYFSAKGGKYATFYYNSNTSSGGLTVSQISTYCIPTSGTSCTVTIPSEVTSSMGKYNSPYKGVSTSTGNMNSSSLAISDNTTFYANYSKQVTNYYYNSGYTSRVIYRNEYFTSTSAMESRLATSNTSISNYSTAVGPGSSVWTGLSTGSDTTSEYTSVQAAANSNTANLYTVYTFNVSYAKGANVSSIGATSGSCTVTSSNTSCSVTLPTITANENYGSVGWSTTNGATSGTAAGASYTLSSNGSTLFGNASRLYTCPTSRTPASYNYGGYQTSRYGSYQSACQSRSGANPECGSTTVCGSEYSDYECHVSWEPDCGQTGPHYNADRDWYYYCGYSNQIRNNSCTSYTCPNSVATWNYTYGEPQTAPYGDYQDQCV